LLNDINEVLKRPPNFDVPKTQIIKNKNEILRYNSCLVSSIKKDESSFSTLSDSFDLVGVDFVFEPQQKYKLKFEEKSSPEKDELFYADLLSFIQKNSLSEDSILDIKVQIINENKTYSKKLIEMIEYKIPSENIILEQGKWKKFNEIYIRQLKSFVDRIELEDTEEVFKVIHFSETNFNDIKKNPHLLSFNYRTADKMFQRISLKE
jgi:hypothetical protein